MDLTTGQVAELKEEAQQRRAQRDRRGLYGKFRVERTDGRNEPRDQAARYFVLDYVGDRHARAALLAYAASIREENPPLAADIDRELDDSREDHHRFGFGHRC
jgi:hypothetical protein